MYRIILAILFGVLTDLWSELKHIHYKHDLFEKKKVKPAYHLLSISLSILFIGLSILAVGWNNIDIVCSGIMGGFLGGYMGTLYREYVLLEADKKTLALN